jgi:cysteine desulfurase/selenocysteine lyase
MTPAALRTHIPLLQHTTWLNAAASSPTPQEVFDAEAAHLRDIHERGDTGFLGWLRFRDEVRARLARFIGATPRQVAFTPHTTFGFNVIAKMVRARGIREVLTLEHEFPTTTLPLLYEGLTLRGVRARADGTFSLEDLERALTPQTGAIAVSAVQFASGFRIDLERVSALCRARGLTFIVNAAQGLGHVPLDVKRLGIHFLAATGHKWFMSGFGNGVLVIDEAWLDEVALPFGGWLSVDPRVQFQSWAHADRVDDAAGFTARGTKFRMEASALEGGATAFIGLFGVNAALGLFEAVGMETVLAHNIRLQLLLREGLRQRGFVPNLTDDPQTLSGICVVPVQGAPLDAVRALRTRGVATTPRGAGVRISTHVYNTEEDVDRLLAAIDALGLAPA